MRFQDCVKEVKISQEGKLVKHYVRECQGGEIKYRDTVSGETAEIRNTEYECICRRSVFPKEWKFCPYCGSKFIEVGNG